MFETCDRCHRRYIINELNKKIKDKNEFFIFSIFNCVVCDHTWISVYYGNIKYPDNLKRLGKLKVIK